MLVKVGDRTYGWGAEVRDLPNNSEAYGSKLLSEGEMLELSRAIRGSGWTPCWRWAVSDRVVFLCEPEKWRQSITAANMAGQFYQVREEPAAALSVPSASEPEPAPEPGPPVVEHAGEPIDALPEIEHED